VKRPHKSTFKAGFARRPSVAAKLVHAGSCHPALSRNRRRRSLGHLSQEAWRPSAATEHRQDEAGGTAAARMILPRSFIRPQRNGGGHDHLAVAGGFRECEREEGLGDTVRLRQAARVFAGKGAGAQPGAHDPGSSRFARTRVW
jgi:hypothetical protein